MLGNSDYKPISPEEMLNLYAEGGKPALMEKMCVFPEGFSHLNDTMEQMIDVAIAAFKGTLPIDKMAEEMGRLGLVLKEQICDVALDKIIETEDEDEKGELFEALSFLNNETSEPHPEQKDRPKLEKLNKFGPDARRRARKR